MLKNFTGRIYHFIMAIARTFLNFKEPTVLNSYNELIDTLDKLNKDKVLIVTDSFLVKLPTCGELIKVLKTKYNVEVVDNILPNPDVEQIEDAVNNYPDVDCVIGFGGGSAMDAAKAIAARIANPNKSLAKLKGLLHVSNKPITLVAIPTTAGTGSECTVAAVISDHKNKEKFVINDPKLIPSYVLFIPEVLYGLPSHITATTGMDALTHAVEAYIGHENTKRTKLAAIEATKLIFDNLYTSFIEPTNYEARVNMQKGAYKAGIAFTAAYVGNVHGVAHSLGAFYNTPHGEANAILLPVILEAYGKCVYKKLASLAKNAGIVPRDMETDAAAKLFIEEICELNKKLLINDYIENINPKDYEDLIKHVNNEVYPLYPVPRYFSDKELINIYEFVRQI